MSDNEIPFITVNFKLSL